MVVPHADGTKLYLFNFSVAAHLKKTALTKSLMTMLAADLAKQKPQGLACITVSPDGVRIAQRLGMTCRGSLTIDNASEGVFVAG